MLAVKKQAEKEGSTVKGYQERHQAGQGDKQQAKTY